MPAIAEASLGGCPLDKHRAGFGAPIGTGIILAQPETTAPVLVELFSLNPPQNNRSHPGIPYGQYVGGKMVHCLIIRS